MSARIAEVGTRGNAVRGGLDLDLQALELGIALATGDRSAPRQHRLEQRLARCDGLSVGEHIALVQRAQGIAKTDHAELVRAQSEFAEVRTEACTEIQRLHAALKQLQRRARRCAPAFSGRRGPRRTRRTGR